MTVKDASRLYTQKCDLPPEFMNSYSKRLRLISPINTLRNVAKITATTEYIFHANLELIPSNGMIPVFMAFINKGI